MLGPSSPRPALCGQSLIASSSLKSIVIFLSRSLYSSQIERDIAIYVVLIREFFCYPKSRQQCAMGSSTSRLKTRRHQLPSIVTANPSATLSIGLPLDALPLELLLIVFNLAHETAILSALRVVSRQSNRLLVSIIYHKVTLIARVGMLPAKWLRAFGGPAQHCNKHMHIYKTCNDR